MNKIGKVLVFSPCYPPWSTKCHCLCILPTHYFCFLIFSIFFLLLSAPSFSATASIPIPLPRHIPLPLYSPLCSREPNIEVQTCLVITYLLHNYTEVHPFPLYNLCFLRSTLCSAGFVHVCVWGPVAMSLLLCFCTGCSILLS